MREKISIGLDVGSRHINMIKLAVEAGSRKVVDFACVSLNMGHSLEQKLRYLQRLSQEKEMPASAVNIGVAGDSVIVRYIDLPMMSRTEVGKALKYEAQQYIPFKMEEVLFDYHILEQMQERQERLKVLLVAAKKKAVMELVGLIQQAGLRPNLVDVNSFSLINCFGVNGPQQGAQDGFALVNLAFDLVNMNILQGATPFFIRDISMADEVLSLPDGRQQGRFMEQMRPLLRNLIREIRLSIDYYESEFERQVQRIYLSGEGAAVPGLVELFANQVGREVDVWNPLQNLAVDAVRVDSVLLEKSSAMLAVACGLALRGTR